MSQSPTIKTQFLMLNNLIPFFMQSILNFHAKIEQTPTRMCTVSY